jgi:hypothetical protein
MKRTICFKHFDYEVAVKKITEKVYRATLDGQEFCSVYLLDGDWVARNELTEREGDSIKDAVKKLMEVTV